MGITKEALDRFAVNLEYQIYEVDGIHGTLKELSDYFNVDPISVSDLILAGTSIQDALCIAAKGNRPSEKAVEKKLEKKKVVEKKPVPITEKKDSVTKVTLPESVDSASSYSSKTSTDVQEIGDFIVVTTTTTVVYRKGGVK